MTASQSEIDRAYSLLRAGDLCVAESMCRQALTRSPDDGSLQCLLGSILLRQRRPVEAEESLRAVVNGLPDFAKGHEELANALLAQGRPGEARAHLKKVIELDADNGIAHYKLGKVLRSLGEVEQAEESDAIAQRLAPTQIVLARADELRQAGRLDEAEETCSAALTRNPDNAELFHALGIIAMEQQRFGDAIVFLRRAVALVPESAFTHVNLACALVEREKFEEAIRAAKKAIKLEPAAVSPYLVMGGTYSRMGDHEAAISAFREGLDAQPDHAGCLISLGHSLKTIGRRDEAIAVYRRAIARYPDLGDAYWSLANLKAFHFTSAEVAAIEAHVDDEHLSEETRIKFLFALGKAFEDQSRYRRAFKCFQRGNTARRQHEFYDSVQAQDMNDRIMEVLDKRLLAHSVDVAKDAPTPIFIVGLPRSGSTLIEQILASHSQVEGTKELPELERLIGSMNREHRSGLVYPELLREIRSDDRTALARRYLDATQRYRTDRPYFTDKMPNNFRHIGLIRLLFPKGRVIDARRHPLDSCLGSYKQLFIKGQPFTYDLFELGEYYLEYRRLMDHWNTLLPGYIHEVQYETMVSEPEVQIRRLLAYCGLSWEDACLDFHETNRAIDSASSEQVRQPIYTSSMHNWRDYERDLAPLIETLRPVLEELPEELRPATLNQQ